MIDDRFSIANGKGTNTVDAYLGQPDLNVTMGSQTGKGGYILGNTLLPGTSGGAFAGIQGGDGLPSQYVFGSKFSSPLPSLPGSFLPPLTVNGVAGVTFDGGMNKVGAFGGVWIIGKYGYVGAGYGNLNSNPAMRGVLPPAFSTPSSPGVTMQENQWFLQGGLFTPSPR